MVDPGIQFKPVERDALATNRDLSEMRPDFRVEAVSVHAEVARRIPEPEEPRGESRWFIRFEVHARLGISDQDKSLSRLPVHARVRGWW